MAQKFVSPGVFTRELDQSFLAQGVAGIGAVLIGRTSDGPAFVPVRVGSFDEFASRFGMYGLDTTMQLPYAARNYLKNSTSLTVVRVLGSVDGLSINNGYAVGSVLGIADNSASNGQVLAVVHVSGGLTGVTVAGVPNDANNFIFTIGTFTATASFLTSSDNYISKVLNSDPTKYSKYFHYVQKVYPFAVPKASASWTAVSGAAGVNTFERDYEHGVTPWIKSQPLGGVEFNLFKLHTLADGNVTNDGIKVTIANVRPSSAPNTQPYGSFDVQVRSFYDTDQRPVVLETFVNCDLNPNSPNYIARRIGDKYEAFDTIQRKFISYGNFPSKSKYVRVEMNTTDDAPPQAIPWGFRGYVRQPFGSGSAEPALPYTLTQKDKNGNIDQNICWGVSFVSGGIADRMRPVPDGVSAGYGLTDTDFSMGFLTSSYYNGRQLWTYSSGLSPQHSAIIASASLYRFTLPFQGGFDGFDLRTRDPLYLQNGDDETVIGVVALKRAVDTVANPDAFDMNVIAIPGVHNLRVTDYERQMANSRNDVFVVMDLTGSSVTEVVQNLQGRQVDDNYAASYYPDVYLYDDVNKANVRVAPSAVVVPALAYNDKVGEPWFAPAGLNRGGLKQFGVVDVVDRVDFKDRDTLYINRVNPIATFPDVGVVIWGQKTLQQASSALDRVNVRRLLIFAKKTVASAAKVLLFEPNNPSTWERFTKAVNPIFDDMKKKNGVERFKVVMDTTTNTQDVIDRNTMVGKIFLQPTKAAEFIDLSFVITNAGVSFDE